MPDYRGGPRQISPWGAERIKAIREGRTEGQYQRNFNTNAIVTAAKGAAQVGGGILSGIKSKQLQKQQAEKDAARAQAGKDLELSQGQERADMERVNQGAARDKSLMRSSEQYASPDYTGRTSADSTVPSWLDDSMRRYSMEDDAKDALSRQGANDAAHDAPVGGQYTKDGAATSYGNADSQARDMQTGTGLMKSGGLAGTNPMDTPSGPDDEYASPVGKYR